VSFFLLHYIWLINVQMKTLFFLSKNLHIAPLIVASG